MRDCSTAQNEKSEFKKILETNFKETLDPVVLHLRQQEGLRFIQSWSG